MTQKSWPRWRLGALGLMLALGCSSCTLGESYLKRRLEELEKLEGKAKPPTRAKIAKKRTELAAAFSRLPTKGKGRKEALTRLSERARLAVKESKELLSAESVAEEQLDQKELKKYQQKFVGRWQGEGMFLAISADGKLNYRRRKGVSSRSLSGKIQKFKKDSFKAGVLGLGTTFKIDRAPYQEDGVWKVKIDGVVLTRVVKQAKPRLGIFVCTELKGGRCVKPRASFTGQPAKLFVRYVTAKLPAAGQTFSVLWIAEDVGKAAPPNTTIAKTDLTNNKADAGKAASWAITGNLSAPKKGWPPGRYRVEIRSAGDLVISTGFKIVDAPAPAP